MGTRLVHFKVGTFPKMRVIGKGVTLIEGSVSPEDSTIEDLWERISQDGSLDLLAQLPGRVGPRGDMVGWMGDFHPPDMQFTYLAGALFEAGVEAPEGFIARDIQAGEMAVSRIQSTDGPEGGDIHIDASAINSRAMKANGYEYDGSRGLYEMEYQSHEHYYAPLDRGEHPILDFYSPCKQVEVSG
jgi:predicted transcriptional regulator YdeE